LKTAVHITTVHHPFDNRIFYKECVSLAEMGYRVVLVVPHERDEVVQGVEIRALPKPRNRFFRIFFTTWQACGMSLKEQADICHFHDPELIPVGMFLRMLGKKVVYDIHEDYVTSMLYVDRAYLPGPIRFLASRAMAGIESLCGRFFEKVLAEKYYTKRFPRGVQVLNYSRTDLYPVPKNHLSIPSATSCISHTHPAPRLLYTGNISKERGAVQHARLVSFMEDVHIFMVGKCDEQLAEELMEAAGAGRDRLHLDGVNRFVPFEKILEYYRQGGWTAGLALFPPSAHYLNKELTKFFEYMAAGIPVICSDFPVWRDLMENTGAGSCVDPEDREAAANAIQYLLDHPEKAVEMGCRGRAAVEKEYNWETQAEQLKGLYQRLIG